MISSEPFISNDLFIHYADIALLQPNISLYDLLAQFQRKSSILIFLQTELLEHYLFQLMMIERPFDLLTTCNDDFCIPYYHFPPINTDVQENHNALLAHPPLRRWFSKNPSIVYPKLFPLPLGPKWQYHSNRFFGEDKAPILSILHKYCMTPSLEPTKLRLLYFHFAQTTSQPFFTYHKNIRQEVVQVLESRFPSSSHADFENYLLQLKEHKFALSPPGRGIDTHRTWEALMVGTIPIVMNSPLNSLYDNLPVLIIEDYSILTPEYLEEQFILFQSRTYDFSKLYSPYWKQMVSSHK